MHCSVTDKCVQHVQQLFPKTNDEEPCEEEMDTSEPNWHWFYLAECGVWHMFEIDPSAGCSVTSEQIEANYNRNQHGSMDFYTPKYSYRLDFSVMKQINITTGKQRPIKRALHSATGFRDTFEYKEVVRLYERTMSQPIKSIQRIQNLDLWEFFCRKKAQLRKIKRVDIDERMLFHGTGHSNIQAICTYNFDWRLTGSHGDVYGKGSYFARDAKYSSKFCHSTSKHNFILKRHGLASPIFQSDPPYKCMFLARVLVGEYTVGTPHFCRPPSKDLSIANFYDSCVDDVVNPKIFVIFDSNQIYPEYLIEFY
ncbi:Poly [ADP-ribose] polymerase 11 [Bagarius yarrelli]|uniref:Poly [ADP-ribose] polymerase n=1 Tax=Bagarius yarrelli TaxID=175774 RepID=A0A556TH43_BAGYA|nr:Poly [ADP-ribose] polymerase 11 [Bagarius yarrelli]